MIDIKSLPLPALQEELSAGGEKPYRAGQIYEWLHKHLKESFAEMTNIPLATRDRLATRYYLTSFSLNKVLISALDGTRKYLFTLPDGRSVESVLLKYKHGNSVCISSQVGCRMGCVFCASTIGGLARSLSAGEMLEQIYAVTRHTGERVSHVVVMGMGEPLDNFDQLVCFVRMISAEKGLNISQRNITVSTCGLVPEIYRLAEQNLQINLAVSLHAAADEKRRRLMPIALKYSLEELFAACRYYFERTGRRITFEYSLIDGVNDTAADAKELKELLRAFGNPFHLNLISLNPVKEREFRASAAEKTREFKNLLEKYQNSVTIRREMGRDLDGACGQLRI